MTDAAWAPQALDQPRVTALVAQRPPHGLLLLDDPGLPKQGRRAVGVARQAAGTLGTVAQGQGVVSAHAVAEEPTSRAPVHGPLTARLSRPEAWAAESARRAKGRVPTDVTLQTKPEVALARVGRPVQDNEVFVTPDGNHSYRIVALPLGDEQSRVDHVLCHLTRA